MGDFNVQHNADADPEDDARWRVFLPHQCDDWQITPESRWDWYLTQDDAIAALEAFLADGQAALEALKNGEEYGDEH